MSIIFQFSWVSVEVLEERKVGMKGHSYNTNISEGEEGGL